jgi:hypothetical protein
MELGVVVVSRIVIVVCFGALSHPDMVVAVELVSGFGLLEMQLGVVAVVLPTVVVSRPVLVLPVVPRAPHVRALPLCRMCAATVHFVLVLRVLVAASNLYSWAYPLLRSGCRAS